MAHPSTTHNTSTETVCLTCGDRGFPETLVFCKECQACALHRYCLDGPVIFWEEVSWFCEDCEAKPVETSSLGESIRVSSETSDSVSLAKDAIKARRELGNCINKVKESNQQPHKMIEEEKQKKIKVGSQQQQKKNEEKSQKKRKVSDQHQQKMIEEEKQKKKEVSNQQPKVIEEEKQKKKEVSNRQQKMIEKEKQKKTEVSNQQQKKKEEEEKKIRKVSDQQKQKMKEKEKQKKKEASNQQQKKIQEKQKISEVNPGLVVKTKAPLSDSRRLPQLEHIQCSNRCEDGSKIKNDHGPLPTDAANPIVGSEPVQASSLATDDDLDCVELGRHALAQPVANPVWRGSFNFCNKNIGLVTGLLAHMSSLACSKVREEAVRFSEVLCADLLPTSAVWPKSFKNEGPTDQSIALYFFPESERVEKAFDKLVGDIIQCKLAIRVVGENAELLVFPSTALPIEHWRFQAKYYLWGVFRRKQASHKTNE